MADSVTSDWYYAKRGALPGQQAGPLTWEQLLAYARAGAVAPDDLVWHPQLPQWLPAGQVSGLFPAAAFPGGPGPYPASSTGRGRSWLAWVIPLVALLLVGAGLALVLVLTRGDDDKGSTASTRTTLPAGSTASTASNAAAFTQGEGEVFLEVAGTAGPDSFAGAALLFDHAVTSPTSIPPITPVSTLPGMPVQIASYSGGTPGLYGGSRSKLIADKDAQLKFLQENLDKAKAFCAALNADPTLRWSGGTQVKPEQLAAYFAELTPLMLIRDTRVTNNGFRNGQPTPRQSVLQAGQMVLVDRYGVPRARCECGNPLTPPKPVENPTYTGPRWSDFEPTAIVIIEQAAAIIDNFVLVDVDTGGTFDRPAGTSGNQDVAPVTTTTTTVNTSGPVEELFSVSSIGAVDNGATPATFTIDQAWLVTLIQTYHWNGAQGASPGTIGLRAADGTMYGPWQAAGGEGQGGVPNAYWVVNPNIVIPAGDYTVIDSDPSTWAQNGETNGVGMCLGNGIRQGNP